MCYKPKSHKICIVPESRHIYITVGEQPPLTSYHWHNMAATDTVRFLEAVVWRDWNNQTAETMSGMCKFGVWLILDSKCVTKCIMWAYSRSFKIDMLMVKASVCQWWLLLSSWACKWWLPDVGGKRHILWVVADKFIFQFLVDDQW